MTDTYPASLRWLCVDQAGADIQSSSDLVSVSFGFFGTLKHGTKNDSIILFAHPHLRLPLTLVLSGDPAKRARAIVQAVTHYNNPQMLAELSTDLGEAMVGISV